MLVTINVVFALLLILRFYCGKGKTLPVYAMKVCGRVEVYFPSFLTSALDACMWSVSHLGHFTLRNETVVPIQQKAVWTPELVWLL